VKPVAGSDTAVQSAANAYTNIAATSVDNGTRWKIRRVRRCGAQSLALLQFQMMRCGTPDSYVSDFVSMRRHGVSVSCRADILDTPIWRRSSDNAEIDVGFSGRSGHRLHDCSIGAGDGFVKTIYDQSGNGKDFTQVTNSNQGKIVSSERTGYVRGDGSTTQMTATSVGSGSNQVVSLFGRFSIGNTSAGSVAYFLDAGYYQSGINGFGLYFDPRVGAGNYYSIATSKSTSYNANLFEAGPAITGISPVSVLINSGYSAGYAWYINGTASVPSGGDNHEASQYTFSSHDIVLGNYSSGSYLSAWKLESLVLVESDAMSVRSSVESAL
jgi:hypothetical protein